MYKKAPLLAESFLLIKNYFLALRTLLLRMACALRALALEPVAFLLVGILG